jgi:hypothetical protein
MAFRQRNTASTAFEAGLASKVRVLEQLLVRHYADPGFDKLEIRRFGGRLGYVPTNIPPWEDDGQDASLEDEGEIVLISGERPADLAATILGEVQEHSDQAGGKRQSYRVVATRRVEGEQGTTVEEPVFELLLTAALFEEAEQTPATEQHDAVMATWTQMHRQNDFLFKILMKVLERWPDVMGKSIDMIEQLGDLLGASGNVSTEALFKIYEHESAREQRWMAHDAAKARAGHRADVFGKAVEVTAPGFMALFQKLFESFMAKQSDESAKTGDAPPSAPSGGSKTGGASPSAPKSSGLADRLERALGLAPPAGIRKAREILTQAEWDLLEAAQNALTDDEFRAIFTRWIAEFGRRPKADSAQIMVQLMMYLGADAVAEFTELIQIVQS